VRQFHVLDAMYPLPEREQHTFVRWELVQHSLGLDLNEERRAIAGADEVLGLTAVRIKGAAWLWDTPISPPHGSSLRIERCPAPDCSASTRASSTPDKQPDLPH
jgi:hypothetical protein